MLRDGYAAVTSRRLELETGLKVHYHFGGLDVSKPVRAVGNMARRRPATSTLDNPGGEYPAHISIPGSSRSRSRVRSST